MPPTKQYKMSTADYEAKLSRVMDRLGVPTSEYNYDFTRNTAWIDFHRSGKYSRFEHSVANAASHGTKLSYGSDVFAKLVLTLEDLARAMQDGVFTFDMFVKGLPQIAAPSPLPTWAQEMGFTALPSSVEEIEQQYRTLAKQRHPDRGGCNADMAALNQASEQALAWWEAQHVQMH